MCDKSSVSEYEDAVQVEGIEYTDDDEVGYTMMMNTSQAVDRQGQHKFVNKQYLLRDPTIIRLPRTLTALTAATF